jgi:hypothetical protein
LTGENLPFTLNSIRTNGGFMMKPYMVPLEGNVFQDWVSISVSGSSSSQGYGLGQSYGCLEIYDIVCIFLLTGENLPFTINSIE